MRTLVNTSFALAALLAVACGGSEKETTEPTSTPDPVTKTQPKPEPTPEQPQPTPEAVKEPEAPPAPVYTHGRFVWFEHWAKSEKDNQAARAFYTELFGWNYTEQEMGGMKFTAIMNGEMPIGMTSTLDKKSPVKGKSLWMGFISVPDVDAASTSAQENGGKVLLGPTDMEGVGRFATFTDPHGGVYGVVKATNGDGPQQAPKAGEFGWMELWAKKAKESEKIVGFYSTVVGYQGQPDGMGVKGYTLLSFEGTPYAGIASKAPQAKYAGWWVPYVFVDDVDGKVAQVKKLKGKVIDKPKDIPNVGRVAVISDPSGAVIGLFGAPKAADEAAPAGDQ